MLFCRSASRQLPCAPPMYSLNLDHQPCRANFDLVMRTHLRKIMPNHCGRGLGLSLIKTNWSVLESGKRNLAELSCSSAAGTIILHAQVDRKGSMTRTGGE